MRSHFFTSESVSEGHPDKIADQISDAILDAFLAEDVDAHVSCQSFVAHRLIVVAGEFRTHETLFRKIEAAAAGIVRATLRRIGYRGAAEDADTGCDPDAVEVRIAFNRQSEDIDQGVSRGGGVIGAGDQGMMFGYACDETPELMPLALALAHALVRRQAEARKSGALPWLRPDAKAQVTLRCDDGRAMGVEQVVLSTQHARAVGLDELRRAVRREIIEAAIPAQLRSPRFECLINPTGRFVVGGPRGDTGLTGRKIIVDSYGGSCPHGGGSFSGKDPTKVDRSAAYMARYAAKQVVAAGLARRCTLQLAYAIGVPEPLSVGLDTQGTGCVDEAKLEEVVRGFFDFTPAGIIAALDLQRPIYAQTSVYGHFGRELADFTWERTDRAEALRRALLG
ncbi:MAG: methionine adenosyltransferase [Burkholderiales bacterium]|jgi:S-adenosylmethionine synthetase